MKNKTKTLGSFKKLLATLFKYSYKIEILVRTPKLKIWEKDYIRNVVFCESRFELYDYLQKKIIGGNPINYMEFGVAGGETIHYWSKINQEKSSKFYGFDTFTGLPQEWKGLLSDRPVGAFDCGGKIPNIDDSRVSFVKGIFQETLDEFLKKYENNNQLIIHNDSDLYSSTLYVLTKMDKFLKKNAIVIFDEFSNVMDEFRALEDYCISYNKKYRVIASTKDYYQQVAIIFEN